MATSNKAMTSSERAAMGATRGDNARVGQSIDHAPESPSEAILRVSAANVKELMLHATGHDRQVRGDFEAGVWLEHIEGMPFDEVKAAIYEYFRQSRWPITPGDIKNIIEEGVPL